MVRKSLVALLVFLFMSLGFIGTSKALSPKECWWEIIIRLTSKGAYTLEEAKTSYSGKYAYTIQWSGCMEQDGQDFILYHEDSELLRWEPQEKKKRSDTSETKITKKFSEKPSFALNYILTKKENIHFDFLVRGFQVPQLDPSHQYYLHLPASKENSYHPTDIAYDLHIYKGSNQVYFSKDDLLDESIKKDFHWSWKRHSSAGDAENFSYLSHSYDVDVEISILRHLKKNPAES
ncbi:MAG: hypothetical protein V3V48_07010 [Candidatus Aminicenantaceae bacterium]|jgi:hypothetical protein